MSCKKPYTEWGRWVRGGLGLGPSLAAVDLYFKSANSVLLANLVSSLYRNGKDLGHHTCETTWSPVALFFRVRASLVASSSCPCAEPTI